MAKQDKIVLEATGAVLRKDGGVDQRTFGNTTGYKHSQATLEKLRIAATGKPGNSGMTGKKHSAETLEKLRHINEGRVGENSAIKMAHHRIMEEVALLEMGGYKCIPITSVIPDIIALKDGKVYAVEVEYQKPNYSKYDKDNYKARFDEVIWINKV